MAAIEKRGRSWVVLDRDGYPVSKHRTEEAALDAAGIRYIRRRPRRRRVVERVVIVSREGMRRRRRRNPWTVETNE